MGDGVTEENSLSNTAAEADRLGVDPVVRARVRKYWAETNEDNKGDTLEGYDLGTLRRHDLKSLKVLMRRVGNSQGASPLIRQ